MSEDFRGRGARGANQRSAWNRDQAQALAMLDRILRQTRWSDQRKDWCRRWVEWYLRWLGPEDWRTTTPEHLARFLDRHHRRGKPKWQLTQGLQHLLFFLARAAGRDDLTVDAVRDAWKRRPVEPTRARRARTWVADLAHEFPSPSEQAG